MPLFYGMFLPVTDTAVIGPPVAVLFKGNAPASTFPGQGPGFVYSNPLQKPVQHVRVYLSPFSALAFLSEMYSP